LVERQKQRSYEITCSREWFVAFGVCVGSVYSSDFLEEKKKAKENCGKITKSGGVESCERIVD
jgi:hypothetical protein